MGYEFAQSQMDNWSATLWRISQEANMPIELAGDIQDIAEQMRKVSGLPELEH